MIDLCLAPDEELIRETARSFARERLLPALRAHEAAGGVGGAVVRAYRALGFATMEAPEAAGGQGLPPLAKMVVLEA